jgi:hypothetical protein
MNTSGGGQMAGREQRKYMYKHLFHEELTVLDSAKEASQRKDASAEDMQVLYEQLMTDYEKLLKTAMKLSRISDIQGQTLKKQELELQDAHESLQHQETIRRQLIADISHELGTPMSTIQGYVKAMLDQVITADEKYLRMIYNKILTVNQLIKDLFLLSTHKAQQLPSYRRPLKVHLLLQQVYEQYVQISKLAASPQQLQPMEDIPQVERLVIWTEPAELERALGIVHERAKQLVLNGEYLTIHIDLRMHHHDSRLGKLYIQVSTRDNASSEAVKLAPAESYGEGVTVQMTEHTTLLTIPVEFLVENYESSALKEMEHG